MFLSSCRNTIINQSAGVFSLSCFLMTFSPDVYFLRPFFLELLHHQVSWQNNSVLRHFLFINLSEVNFRIFPIYQYWLITVIDWELLVGILITKWQLAIHGSDHHWRTLSSFLSFLITYSWSFRNIIWIKRQLFTTSSSHNMLKGESCLGDIISFPSRSTIQNETAKAI